MNKRIASCIEWDIDDDDVNLPSEVVIPDEICDEDIEDYLSDTYGFCHYGYTLN